MVINLRSAASSDMYIVFRWSLANFVFGIVPITDFAISFLRSCGWIVSRVIKFGKLSIKFWGPNSDSSRWTRMWIFGAVIWFEEVGASWFSFLEFLGPVLSTPAWYQVVCCNNKFGVELAESVNDFWLTLPHIISFGFKHNDIIPLQNQILSLTAIEQEGSSSGGHRNLRFLKTTFIKYVKLIGHVQDFDLKFSDPDVKSLREREEAAVKYVLFSLFADLYSSKLTPCFVSMHEGGSFSWPLISFS